MKALHGFAVYRQTNWPFDHPLHGSLFGSYLQ